METVRMSSTGDATPLVVASNASAVSWSAVFAGAVVAAATSLVLWTLGIAIWSGMASPLPDKGASATTILSSVAIGLILIEWLSSAFGGYMTGRLRTRWEGIHEDEVFFRDTAHGFLSWAIANIIVAVTLLSLAYAGVSGAVGAMSTVASGAARGSAQSMSGRAANVATPTDYVIDMMFRQEGAPLTGAAAVAAGASGINARAEAGRLIAGEVTGTRPLSDADRRYLALIVGQQTGQSTDAAQRRVDAGLQQVNDAKAKARDAAEEARKATAAAALVTALALVVGAFIASAMAGFGGRLRDV